MRYVIKRVYEPASDDDGFRVLVDRVWPRGVSKEKAHLDLWAKDIAPSTELRKWYGHVPERFGEFARRYREELGANPEALAEARSWGEEHDRVTLLYGAHDGETSQAAVLRDLLASPPVE